eukprot:1879687-Amphidinium_carterae.1
MCIVQREPICLLFGPDLSQLLVQATTSSSLSTATPASRVDALLSEAQEVEDEALSAVLSGDIALCATQHSNIIPELLQRKVPPRK